MSFGALVRRYAFDVLVLAVTLAVQIEIWVASVPGPKLGVAPVALLATASLLLRRRFPFAAPACVFAALAGLTFIHPQATAGSKATVFALLLAFWAAGSHPERHQAVAGLLIGVAAPWVVAERDPSVPVDEVVSILIAGGGAWLAAFVLQRRTRRAVELEEHTARLEREREERARAAAAEERRRIAGDLHAVIAHSVSAMTVQAGAARVLLADEPARARSSLLAVEETGREALGEMRRLLGILRENEPEASLAPQPGLAELEALPVEVTVEGDRRALPPGVELAAYSIVEEALAGATRARVCLCFRADALDVLVSTDGGASDDGVRMGERAALYGGELEVAPQPGGGHAVHVRLPLEPAQPRRPISPPEAPEQRRERSGIVSLVRRRGFDALVVALALVSLVEIWVASVAGPKVVIVPAALLSTLPLLLRRRAPFAAPVLVFAVQAGVSFADPEAGGGVNGLFSLLLAFWVVGACNPRNRAAAGAAIGFASLVVIALRDVRVGYGELANLIVLGGALALLAFVLRRRARRAAELEERAARLEGEREERARAAVAEERRRIARDLHDVIAHSVSVMTVQAGAARLLLGDEPERARDSLLAVEETGRQALGEMRRLLGILRADDAEAVLAPQPGLGRIESLLAQARTAGLPVDLTLEGEPRALPAGVDLAAYRIVQEALTNARKHGGPARATVALRYGGESIELEIADDGRGVAAAGGGGHGLVGMRERAALYGGELEAGPQPGGGYAVRARLPLEAARSEPTGRHAGSSREAVR